MSDTLQRSISTQLHNNLLMSIVLAQAQESKSTAKPWASQTKKKLSTSSREDMAAGAIAGTTARFIVAPLDVLKIRFQLQVSTRFILPLMTYSSCITSCYTHLHYMCTSIYRQPLVQLGNIHRFQRHSQLSSEKKVSVPSGRVTSLHR